MESLSQTKVCRVCYKDIPFEGLSTFIENDSIMCGECFSKIHLRIKRFRLENISGFSLYEYDETIRKNLYQLKGCFDIEMAPVFLYKYAHELKIKFSEYYLVPMPSWKDDDEKRGFNHVIEIFKIVGLPILPILYKIENLKQATSNKDNREKMVSNIGCFAPLILRNKKILLVDDVMTTGSTLKGAIKEVSKCHPKDIKILILANHQNEGGNDNARKS